jgi:hypothetical protein
MFNNVFRKSYRILDNVDKYGRARLATDNNIIWRRKAVIHYNFPTHAQFFTTLLPIPG